jgi:hypothetical protein
MMTEIQLTPEKDIKMDQGIVGVITNLLDENCICFFSFFFFDLLTDMINLQRNEKRVTIIIEEIQEYQIHNLTTREKLGMKLRIQIEIKEVVVLVMTIEKT